MFKGLKLRRYCKALESPPAATRRGADKVLGRLADVHAFEPLIVALEDSYDGVRCASHEVLGKLGDAGTEKPFSRILRDPDAYFRLPATDDLVRLGDSGIPMFVAALDDSEGHVCQVATDGLGRLCDPLAIISLAKVLGYSGALVRITSAKALGIFNAFLVKPMIRRRGDPMRVA